MTEKPEKYLTIKENGTHELVIKKSRIICSMARTNTVEEAEIFVKKITNLYKDATHNTYAYTIGFDNTCVKACDNGEPSGTAGIPELKALQLMNLNNITAVVTRYFGGIKLGAGGLIRAYSNSVTQAAENIGVIKCILQKKVSFAIQYKHLDKILYFLRQNHISIFKQEYTTDINLTVLLDSSDIDKFEQDINNILAKHVEFSIGQDLYNEILLTDFDYHNQ